MSTKLGDLLAIKMFFKIVNNQYVFDGTNFSLWAKNRILLWCKSTILNSFWSNLWLANAKPKILESCVKSLAFLKAHIMIFAQEKK